MTLKLSVILGAAGGVRHKRFSPENGLEKGIRSWLDSPPQSVKLNFSLMMVTSSRWRDREAMTRTTGWSGVMRPSCG